MDKYRLKPTDIHPGVQCRQCRKLGMRRGRDSWKCPTCGAKSRQAHLETLKDYELLFENEITNEEIRRFACLDSRKVAWKLLKEACVETYGTNKARIYKLILVRKHKG